MAIIADRVVVELEAKLDKYNANLKRAEQTFSKSIGSQQADMRRLEAQISRSSSGIGSSLRGLAATFAAAFSVQQVIALADGYTRFTNQLKVAGVEGERLAGVQTKLFDIAQRYGQNLETLGTLYGRTTQGAKELGATQADLVQFTTGVAAALKIQGTSAADSRGALIQLTQALGGEIVRAEEFNSINEGARPILQAVANGIDKYAGSVAKLRQDVIKGKVASADFFQGFLKGSADLAAQADKATLTIGNSFTVLNNALGLYIGQTDDALSATERVSAAIVSLSENLDKVTTAVAVIGSVLLGRLVGGLTAATLAMIASAGAAAGATTAIGTLGAVSATAGRAMLAAFGGPVGLAIAALATGLYFLATRNDEATAATADYTKQLDFARAQNDKTADAVDRLATATGRAREQALANAKALRQETLQLLANAKAATLAARAKLGTTITQNRAVLAAARRPTVGATGGDPYGMAGIGTAFENRAGSQRETQARRNILAGETAVGELTKQIASLDASISAAPAVRDTPAATGKKGPKGKSAETLANEAARAAEQQARAEAEYLSEIDRLNADELAAKAQLSGRLEDRLAAELARIDAEASAFARQIALDDELDATKRAKLLAERGQVDALQRQQAEQDAALAALERAKTLADADNAFAQSMLRAQLDVTDGRKARAEIERRLLKLQQSQERAELEQTVATLELLGTREEELRIAKARLQNLDVREGLEREAQDRSNEGPLARYSRDLNSRDVGEQAEQLIIDEIERVREGISSAISDAIGTKDPLILGLLDILLQEVLLKPMAEALSRARGGSGGGGLGGIIASVLGAVISGQTGGAGLGGTISGAAIGSTPTFGRASGGHVRGGGLYRVNETGIEGFQPGGSGKIIPLGRMRSAGGAGRVTLQQTVNVDARGVNPDGFAEHIKAAVRQETVAIVGQGMRQVSAKMPARMAQFERDGT